LWGGYGDTKPEIVYIYRYGAGKWTRQLTKGSYPPTGLGNGGCCVSGRNLYLIGGYDGRSRHEVLHELNTSKWIWSKISDGSAGGPGK